MNNSIQNFRSGDGLLIVDVQWDFCPGGTLPVPDGHQVVPILNGCIDVALQRNIPMYASRDWHPRNHVSFTSRGGPWPPHCIQDTDGAQFHPELHINSNVVVVTKGTRFDRDQTSAFDETGLSAQMSHDGVKRLFVGGLAQDGCVLASVMDALAAGLTVCLIRSATRPVDDEKGRRALETMIKAGVDMV